MATRPTSRQRLSLQTGGGSVGGTTYSPLGLHTDFEYPEAVTERKRSLISQASRVVVTVGLEPTVPSM